MGQFVNTVKQETVFLLNPLNGCLSLHNFRLDRLLTSSLVLRLMLGRARRPAKRRQGHTLPLNGLLPPCQLLLGCLNCSRHVSQAIPQGREIQCLIPRPAIQQSNSLSPPLHRILLLLSKRACSCKATHFPWVQTSRRGRRCSSTPNQLQ